MDPDEDVASKPLSPAADGRGWKYSGRENGCANNSEPTIRPPSALTKLPLDEPGKKTCPMAVTTNGYNSPVRTRVTAVVRSAMSKVRMAIT